MSTKELSATIGVATRIRDRDWSTHPLGPFNAWPPALHGALAACLTARSPMQVWWGTSAIFFYNDAFVPWLGDRHPNALGQRVADVYSDRWPTLCSAVQRVFVAAEVTEAGPFLLSPIRVGESVEGIICTFAADRLAEELLSAVDEDVRRPLRSLSSLISTRTQEDRSADHDFRQLLHAVDDLLDVTRLGRGRLVLDHDPIELETIIGDAFETLSTVSREHSITLSMRIEPGLRIVADRKRLARAFCRLLLQIIRARDGSCIVVSAQRVGTDAEVSVSVPSDVPLQTVRVAPSRRIIELHDGHLALDETAHTIVIKVPSHKAASRPTAVSRHALRVLIVEDDDETAETMQVVLQQLGYVVAVAHDGAVAMEVARVFCPEAILMDLQLPVLDGWEVARRLRQKLGDVPIIALTGHDTSSARVRSADAGFVDYFCKPISIAQLDGCLSTYRTGPN